MKIVNTSNIGQINQVLPLLKKMYPEYKKEVLKSHIKEMLDNDVKFIIGYNDKKEVIAVCVYWVAVRLHSGRFLQIDSLFVEPKYRNKKYAAEIVDYLEKLSKKENCQHYVLDVFTENFKALKLYAKNDFKIRGYHLMKKI